MSRTLKAVADLVPGDCFTHRDVLVTVLVAPVSSSDRFGRDMLEVQGRRHDTMAEGPMTFGPSAEVRAAG